VLQGPRRGIDLLKANRSGRFLPTKSGDDDTRESSSSQPQQTALHFRGVNAFVKAPGDLLSARVPGCLVN
jgi:hypothetical protein